MKEITKEQLLEIKNDIDAAKDKAHNLEGRLDLLYQELKEKWNCKTIEEAKKKLQQFQEQLEKIKTDISVQIKEIEKEYEIE